MRSARRDLTNDGHSGLPHPRRETPNSDGKTHLGSAKSNFFASYNDRCENTTKSGKSEEGIPPANK
jgi:hypothetical protein